MLSRGLITIGLEKIRTTTSEALIPNSPSSIGFCDFQRQSSELS